MRIKRKWALDRVCKRRDHVPTSRMHTYAHGEVISLEITDYWSRAGFCDNVQLLRDGVWAVPMGNRWLANQQWGVQPLYEYLQSRC